MRGNFEDDQVLSTNGQTIEACGPIEWELPKDQNLKVRVNVDYTQNGDTRNGHSANDAFKPPDDEWMFVMNTSGDLQPGAAQAHAVALGQNGAKVAEWSGTVTIVAGS